MNERTFKCYRMQYISLCLKEFINFMCRLITNVPDFEKTFSVTTLLA